MPPRPSGIIAAAVGFASIGSIGKSYENNMKGDLKAAHAAAVEHYTNYNQFPTVLTTPTGTESASTMRFQASDNNTVAPTAATTAAVMVLKATSSKSNTVCSITVRTTGAAKPTCP